MDTVLHPDFSGELSPIDNAVGILVKFFHVINQFVDIDVLDVDAGEKKPVNVDGLAIAIPLIVLIAAPVFCLRALRKYATTHKV